MQRFVLYSLCVVAVALAVWLVSGNRASDDAIGVPAPQRGTDAAGADAPRASAAFTALPDAVQGEEELQRDVDAAIRAALGEPQPAPAAGERRELRSLGETEAPIQDDTGTGSETLGRVPQIAGRIPVIGSTPESVPVGSVPDSQPDPETPGDTANEDVTPDVDGAGGQPDVPSGPPEVLSAEEIAQRVEEELPDGFLPPEQLEPAREALAEDILSKSTQAAGWASQ